MMQPVVRHYPVVNYQQQQQQLHPRPGQLQRKQHLILIVAQVLPSSGRTCVMQCHASISVRP